MNRDPEWQRIYYGRKELGLCTKCGKVLPTGSEHAKCDACLAAEQEYREANREKFKAYMQKYHISDREELNAMVHRVSVAAQRLIGPQELTIQKPAPKKDHKCWGCYWATWCGDKFFCPIYKTCIKEKVE